MSRRQTLGPISQSQINSRVGGNAPRPSLGPSRSSNVAEGLVNKPRMSLAVGPTAIAGPPRMSMGPSTMARRASIAPASRKLSIQPIYGAPSSAVPRSSSIAVGRVGADPRNISDKQFINNSIRTLIEYLTRHNFDHAINPKILTRPAVKDFHNIIMFLFRQIDPNYTSSGKLEDEVVTVFKHLGYPYQISKANIAAVGSPHAWPSLLASIMWLIELLSYDEVVAAGEAQQAQQLFHDNGSMGVDPDLATDPSASEKAFQSYLGTAYALFMTGEDDRYAECEENFVSSYETVNSSIRDQIAELEHRNNALTEDIKRVEQRREELPLLQAKENDYEKDLIKFHQLVEQLEKHKEQLEGKVVGREMELSKLQGSVASLNQELEALRDRINTQELSPDDVKRMMSERDQLQQAQEQASEARQVLQRRVWESDMMLRDRVQALEDSARAYNSVAEDLKVVPYTAKHARGRNLSMDVDVRAKKRDGILKTDVRRDILPALQELRTEFVAHSASLRNHCLLEKDTLEDLAAAMGELEERHQLSESKLRRAEESYKREREVLDQAAEVHAKEMETMDARLLRLRDTAVEETRAAAATRRVQEAKIAREMRVEEHQRRVKEITTAVMEVVGLCAEHREMVQLRLGEVREMYVERLESLLTGSAAEAVANFSSLAEEAYSATEYYPTATATAAAASASASSENKVVGTSSVPTGRSTNTASVTSTSASEGTIGMGEPTVGGGDGVDGEMYHEGRVNQEEEEEDHAVRDAHEMSLAEVLSSPYAATFSPQAIHGDEPSSDHRHHHHHAHPMGHDDHHHHHLTAPMPLPLPPHTYTSSMGQHQHHSVYPPAAGDNSSTGYNNNNNNNNINRALNYDAPGGDNNNLV